MGVVYRARDLRLERIVVLKFLPPALRTHEQAKRRFLVEARAAAALQHVNVCTIHEIGETAAGQLFIAMAFVDGESLAAALDRGPLPVAQAIGIARQLAAALQSAHQRGVVHRDVNPANVMLGADGVTRLVDFGVAKVAGSALTKQSFIGKIKPGNDAPAIFMLDGGKGGTYDYNASITYTDDLGTHTVLSPLSLRVVPQDYTGTIIMVMLIVIVGGFIAYRYWYLPRKNGNGAFPWVKKS